MNKALDIGCGRGFNVARLSKKFDSTGIDLSEQNVALCKKRYPDMKFVVMDAGNIKFPDNYFSRVDAMDILEHVDNLRAVIKEVNRVMKKGGIFNINVPAEKSEHWLIKIRPNYHKEIHHVRIFKAGEMQKNLESLGFKMIKEQPRDFLQHIELYFMFKRNNKSSSQVSVGDWRDNIWTKILHVSILYFDKEILTTPLKFLPIWLVTIPMGFIVNSFGNKIFPKSMYYEFIKER